LEAEAQRVSAAETAPSNIASHVCSGARFDERTKLFTYWEDETKKKAGKEFDVQSKCARFLAGRDVGLTSEAPSNNQQPLTATPRTTD
jgi:hypothetical protein